MNILDTLADPQLFGDHFRPPATWAAWRAYLAALFALPMSAEDLALFQQHTGRSEPPAAPASESWVIVGRRGGKSHVAALLGVFLAAFREYRDVLAPGERGTLPIVAADRRQARVVFRYVRALLSAPMLARLVEAERAESIDLTNGVTIEVHTASFRAVRGYTLVGAILDELAFWRTDDAAEPDHEIVSALRPGMATVPGALLLGISSPYARRGVLWKQHREHFGKPSDVLVWQAPSRAMNPTLPESVVQQALEEDEPAARGEYLGEFRLDVEALLTREAVEACVEPDRFEVGRLPGVAYHAFVDPSGGSADSMTRAIAHRENEAAILDCLRERRPPFSPEAVVSEFAETLRSYGVSRVVGDRFAAGFHSELWEKRGIRYAPSEKPKSDLDRELLPALNSGRIVLLANEKLVSQLVGLARRTARGGRDTIDHAPGGHDDLANAAAGVVQLVLSRARGVSPASLYGDQGLCRAEIDAIMQRPGWRRA